jgi:hypothetical protein
VTSLQDAIFDEDDVAERIAERVARDMFAAVVTANAAALRERIAQHAASAS